MCDFLSVYVGWNGEVYCGDMRSHSSAEEHHKLSASLKSKRPPVPMEWTKDDSGESLTVRVPDGLNRDESFYKAMILGDHPTRQALIDHILSSGKFGKNLDLRGCTGLQKLPKGLKVGGDLYLRWCTGLKTLPEGLMVGGDLYLGGCTGLKTLPEGLKVDGDLYLRGCTGLKELPEGLTVGGSLYLGGCTGLQKLPEGLKVGGYLNLYGCTGLKKLPKGLKVGGFLYLRECNESLIKDAKDKGFKVIV